MSPYISTLILLVTISSSLAASAFGPATVHQSEPSMCYASEGEKYYFPGESWQLGGCSMATCIWSNHSGSAQLIVAYESCGVVAADPPCYIAENAELAYPDCCPEAVCPEGEEDEPAIPESSDKTTEAKIEKDEQVEPENKAQDHHQESDSDNEVEDTIEINAGSIDYYDHDEIDPNTDSVAEKFLYQSRHDHDHDHDHQYEDDDSENMIHTSDMGIFGVPDFQDHQGHSDFNSEYQGRKVSPKFHHVDSMYPKFGYHWIF